MRANQTASRDTQHRTTHFHGPDQRRLDNHDDARGLVRGLSQDTSYTVASGADPRFDFSQGTVKPADAGTEAPTTPATAPTPIASHLAHGSAVVAMSPASQASLNKDLKLLIAYQKQHADSLAPYRRRA